LLSVTNSPFLIVAASDRSSCCFRSMYQPDITSSWLLMAVGGRRQSRASRQARETASRKPEAMPWPPTGIKY
jgi:hypothetical protein